MKIPKIVSWALAPCLVVILAVGVAQANLNIGTNFTGQTMLDAPALNIDPITGGGYRFIPPDTDGAVGPNHIVELINGAYAVYNKSGTGKPAPVTSLGLDAFWKAAGVTPSGSFPTTFDPRVVYDPVETVGMLRRWIPAAVPVPAL